MTWDPSLLSQPEASSVEPHIDIHYDGGLAALDLTKFAAFTDQTAALAALQALVAGTLSIKDIKFASADGVTAGTSETDIVAAPSVTVAAGQKVAIVATGKLEEAKSATSVAVHDYTLRRDATLLDSQNFGYTATGSGAIATGDQATFVWLDTPGAGTYVYKVRGLYVASNTSGILANGRILVAVIG